MKDKENEDKLQEQSDTCTVKYMYSHIHVQSDTCTVIYVMGESKKK